MKKKILINALHTEEKRVAIVEGETLVDFYVESSGKEHLRGNIYKGTVTRIEPGLQSVFVNFGPKKHGFLQMREILPEYYSKKAEGKRARVQDVMSKGQEMIVQVEKDERDTKSASLTTYVSLPGRYIVMMPGQDRVGISRKIEEKEDRDRLKEIFNALKLPKNTGFILRTAGSDKTGEDLENDLKYLTKLWSRIQADSKKASSPALIYKEQDIAVRTVRDYLTSDVDEVLIDDPSAIRAVKDFLKKTAPWLKTNIKLYKEPRPIFAAFNLEEQIARINERHVYLPSRGYLVIDKTEALTAIDVNSGRSRKEENIEATAHKTNMEAADEIARQLRLRDIGGLIVIDFIDMSNQKHRKEVERRLKDALSADKAHTDVSGISKFGIVEMTRERLRTAYFDSINRKCEACGGTGIIRTDENTAVMALREMHARAAKGGISGLVCKLPVESLNYLINKKRDDIALMEKEYRISVSIEADVKLSAGHYKLDADKSPEEKEKSAPAAKDQHVRHNKSDVKERETHHRTEQRTEQRTEKEKSEETDKGDSHTKEQHGRQDKAEHKGKRRSRSRGGRSRKGKAGSGGSDKNTGQQSPSADENPPQAETAEIHPESSDVPVEKFEENA